MVLVQPARANEHKSEILYVRWERNFGRPMGTMQSKHSPDLRPYPYLIYKGLDGIVSDGQK